MLEEGDLDPNGKLFLAKLEVPKSGVERSEQGKASENIGLGLIDHRKENQSIAEWLDQIEVRKLDRIRDMIRSNREEQMRARRAERRIRHCVNV